MNMEKPNLPTQSLAEKKKSHEYLYKFAINLEETDSH